MVADKSLSTRLAGILLLRNGELSARDIRALPMVEDNEDVDLIISWLIANFDVELHQKRISSSPISEWDEIISLRSTAVSTS